MSAVLLEAGQVSLMLVLVRVGSMVSSRGRAFQFANDFISHFGAGDEGRFDAHDALDVIADDSGGHVGRDAHEPAHGVDQVRDVVGRVGRGAVPPLAADQQAVALLEAVDPSGAEFRGRLVLVARQLGEDVLGLLGQFFVGGLSAGSHHLLVPEQHELLHVGPVAEA